MLLVGQVWVKMNVFLNRGLQGCGLKMNTVTAAAKGFLPKQAKGFLPKHAKGFLPKRAKGFSMLELLVAVLVMGVGVLGVTGLQMVSLQNNQDALLRGDALQQAYDIMDRIRVNPGIAVPGIAYDGVDMGDDPPNPTDCVANECTAAQIRNFDVAVWKCSLGSFNDDNICITLRTNEVILDPNPQPGLPDGDGSIEVDGAGVITVTVEWTGFNDTTQTIAIDSQG